MQLVNGGMCASKRWLREVFFMEKLTLHHQRLIVIHQRKRKF